MSDVGSDATGDDERGMPRCGQINAFQRFSAISGLAWPLSSAKSDLRLLNTLKKAHAGSRTTRNRGNVG
jgi:hypothetical protein